MATQTQTQTQVQTRAQIVEVVGETVAADTSIVPGKPGEQLQIEAQVDEEADTIWPSGLKLWLNMASIFMTQILLGLDLTIVAVCVPSLTDQFKTVADIGWYSAAYALTACAFNFFFGKVYTLFSVKKLYIASLILFEAGSLLCAVAPTSAAFICGRAIAGVGNSGITGGIQLIVNHSFRNDKRPLIIGMTSGIMTVAMVSAPLLGGALIDAWNWRLCFGINLPLGVIAVVLTIYAFPDPTRNANLDLPLKTRLRRVDPWGTALMIPAISSFLLALQWGGTKYPWHHPSIIVLFTASLGFFAAFTYLQHSLKDDAVLPLRFLKNRTVLAAAWFKFCVNGALTIVEQYLAIYFQSVKGYTAGQSGILGVPLIIGLAIGAPIGGALVSWIGYYSPPMLVTTVLSPIATGLLTTIEVDENNIKVLAYLGLLGVSIGLSFASPSSAVYTNLKPAEIPMGFAVSNFGGTMGAAISICASAALFQKRLIREVREQDPSIDAMWLAGVGLSDISEHISPEKLKMVLKGYDEAVSQTLYMPAALTTLTLVGSMAIGWRSVKAKQS